MKSKAHIAASAVLLAATSLSAGAAVSFNLSWAANSSGGAISQIDSTGSVAPNGTYYAGPLQISGLTGAPSFVPGSFISYCVELTQRTGLGALSGYTVKPNGTTLAEVQPPAAGRAVDSTKLELIGKLVTKADDTWGIVKTSAQGAAVQAAIWEVIYESAGTYKLRGANAGNFVWDAHANTAANNALNAIDGWWATLATVESDYRFGVLYKAGTGSPIYGQDFLVPVPEPEAYGLALAGMGVVAFALRRRRV